MPDALYEASHCESSILFYCPYGHELHFPKTSKEKIQERINGTKEDNVVPLRVVVDNDEPERDSDRMEE